MRKTPHVSLLLITAKDPQRPYRYTAGNCSTTRIGRITVSEAQSRI